MPATLTLVTAAHTGKLEWLADTVASVRAALSGCAPGHVEWRLCLDGDDPVDRDLEHVLEAALADGTLAGLERLGATYGVSAARNAAAVTAHGEWVLPLDGDDLAGAGIGQLARFLTTVGGDVAWVGTNQVHLDGTPTRSWCDEPCRIPAGELNATVTWPLEPFHPNATAVRTGVLWQVGGWPAMPGGEDLALLLRAARDHDGYAHPAVTSRRRFWDGQTTAQAGFRDLRTRQLRHQLLVALDLVGGRTPGGDGLLW